MINLFKKGIIIGSRIAENFIGRGDIKYLILYTILKKPMHGYEIMNEIKNDFSGIYSPSPGTIYPTLQMLEEQELVKVINKNGKKVYQITNNGKKFLKENKSKVSIILKNIKQSKLLPQVRELRKELHEIGFELIKLIKLTAQDSKEKAKKNIIKTRKLLKQTLKEIKSLWND